MKSRKSVGFNQHLKSEKRQLAEQQGTSSISVNKEAGKLEDRLNYYHLVQLNELFKVQKCLMMSWSSSFHSTLYLYAHVHTYMQTGDKTGRGMTVIEFKEALEKVLDCDESGQEV